MSNELIFGFHSIEAILNNAPERLLEIYALKGREDKRLNQVVNDARKFGISVQFMQRKHLITKQMVSNIRALLLMSKGRGLSMKKILMTLFNEKPHRFSWCWMG